MTELRPDLRRLLAHAIRDAGDLPMDTALAITAEVEKFYATWVDTKEGA